MWEPSPTTSSDMKIGLFSFMVCFLLASSTVVLSADDCGADESSEPGVPTTGKPAEAPDNDGQEEQKSNAIDYFDYPSANILAQKKAVALLLDSADNFIEAKKYDKAAASLKKALELASDDADRRYILDELMRCYSKTGRLEDLQKTRREYISRFPTALDAREQREMLRYYDEDFEETRKFEADKQVGFSEGERPWLPASKLPKMPIRLCILSTLQSNAGKDKLSANRVKVFRRLAQRAADEWAKATNYKLKFLLVADRNNADLTCELTMNLAERTHSWASGEQHWSSNSNSSQARALVFLAPKSELTEGDVFQTCVHELGHALGLRHSSHREDAMYHSGNFDSDSVGWPKLSKNDIRRIRAIYAEPFEGQAIAEQFVRAAYSTKDLKVAYQLLRKEQRSRVSFQQFQKRFASKGTHGALEKISVDEFVRSSSSSKYRMSASANQRKCNFLVTIAREANGLKVDNVVKY